MARPGLRSSGGTADVLIWGVAWALAAAMLFFSLGPTPPGASGFPGADKVLHLVTYAATVLAFLLAAVWRPGRGEGRFPWAAPWIVLGAIAIGLAVELVQGAFFDRDAEALDALADAAGAGLAFLAWVGLRRRSSTRT